MLSKKTVNELEVKLKRLYKEGDYKGALSCVDSISRLDSFNSLAAMHRGLILKDKGDFSQAKRWLQLSIYQGGESADGPLALSLLHWKSDEFDLSLGAMRKAVMLAPHDAKLKMILAGMYGSLGKEELSKAAALSAIKAQPYVKYSESKKNPYLKVLAISSPLSSEINFSKNNQGTVYIEGMNNLISVFDRERIEVTRFFVDGDEPESRFLNKLKMFDAVYITLADSDRAEKALAKASQLLKKAKIPILNHPDLVSSCSREGVFKKLSNQKGIVSPRIEALIMEKKGLKNSLEKKLEEFKFTLPVLVRLVGYQGGKFMRLVENINMHECADLENEMNKNGSQAVVVQYSNVGYEDERLPGVVLYKKYRAIMIGGNLYPIHCFTSKSQIVHKENAKPLMDQYPWMVDEEKDYIQDPAAHFGGSHWQNLENAMKLFDLDYNGVDFALGNDADGNESVVVFEANPAMRNRTYELPYGDHVQQAWERATRAFHELICAKSGVDKWDFSLPRNKKEALLLPAGVENKTKHVLGENKLSSNSWVFDKIGSENDFSGSEYFNASGYMGERLIEKTALSYGLSVVRRPKRCLEVRGEGEEVVFLVDSPRVSVPSYFISKNKWIVKSLLNRNDIKTPPARVFDDFHSACCYFSAQKVRQVVKPVGGHSSLGVSVNIGTTDEFIRAWEKARRFDAHVMVEDFLIGEELRVTFLEGEYLGTLLRAAPFVIGDGKSTVKELVGSKNKSRTKNPMTKSFPIIKEGCAVSGVDDGSIPGDGEWVELGQSRTYANGAEYIEISSQVPHDFLALCKKVAGLLPSTLSGLDVFVENIDTFEEVSFLGINASSPGIIGYHFPRYGLPVDVSKKIVEKAFKDFKKPLCNKGEVVPAEVCGPVDLETSNFNKHMLQMVACFHNLYCQDLGVDTLVLGDPAELTWSNGSSTHTAMASAFVLNDKQWLTERFEKYDAIFKKIQGGYSLRILMARNCLVAAQACRSGRWFDVTESLHVGLVDSAVGVMNAIYHPGHALITLSVIDHAQDPKIFGAMLDSVNLYPDLSVFYKDTDQPRDVIPALLGLWMPEYNKNIVEPEVAKIVIKGCWSDRGVIFCQWLDQQLNLYSLQGECHNSASDKISIIVKGQPNAIKSFIDNTRFGDLEEQVVNIDSNFITQEEKFEVQDPDKLTLHLSITGKVQNVGYRRWFADQMEVLGILGWVRNLTDGSVEAVIHGPQNTLQMLLDEVPKGTAGAEVTGLKADLWDGELPKCVEVLSSK